MAHKSRVFFVVLNERQINSPKSAINALSRENKKEKIKILGVYDNFMMGFD